MLPNMKQIQTTSVRTIVPLGIFTIIYYTMISSPSKYNCNIRFENEKYENVTYSLKKNNSRHLPDYNLLAETDYDNLINIRFTFIMQNLVCNNTEPLLLILIHSAPKNFARRNVIRETWGKSEEDIKILFLMGIPDDPDIEDQVRKENFLHNDLLQGNFLDSYRNLTYKHATALKYVVYHCPQAKYILKVDDDVCINMPTLKYFLTKDLSPYGAKNLLMCNIAHRAKAMRSFRSKWRVTFDEYKERFYPTYCIGWYILYSPDVVFQLYMLVQRTNYFWIDDVLITGILPTKLPFIRHTDTSALTLGSWEMQYISKCRYFVFGWADMKERQVRFLWEDIIQNPGPQFDQKSLIT